MARFDEKTLAKLIIQGLCLLTLVALAYIDARSTTYSVPTIVYAIVGGILFGVGGIRQLMGVDDRKDDKHDK